MSFAALRERCLGRLAPRKVQSAVTSQQLLDLGLSSLKEIACSHTQPINDLAIDTVERRYMLSCSTDTRISLYDLTGQTPSRPLHAPSEWASRHTYAVSSVQWYPFDTGMFISSGMDATVKVWDTNTLRAVIEFELDSNVNICRMSPMATSHSLIAAGYNSSHVSLCDIKSGASTHTLLGHKGDVWALAWSPCSEFSLATGSTDQTIRVWDIRRAGAVMVLDYQNNSDPKINSAYLSAADAVNTRHVRSHDGAITHLVFAPDGQHLLSSGTDKRLRLWDAVDGKNTLVNYANTFNSHRVNRFTVSTDGQYVFYPNGIKISMYSMLSGKAVKELKGHMDRVTCLAFHPQATELYSGADDHTIQAWTVQAEEARLKAAADPGSGGDAAVADADDWSDDESAGAGGSAAPGRVDAALPRAAGPGGYRFVDPLVVRAQTQSHSAPHERKHEPAQDFGAGYAGDDADFEASMPRFGAGTAPTDLGLHMGLGLARDVPRQRATRDSRLGYEHGLGFVPASASQFGIRGVLRSARRLCGFPLPGMAGDDRTPEMPGMSSQSGPFGPGRPSNSPDRTSVQTRGVSRSATIAAFLGTTQASTPQGSRAQHMKHIKRARPSREALQPQARPKKVARKK